MYDITGWFHAVSTCAG